MATMRIQLNRQLKKPRMSLQQTIFTNLSRQSLDLVSLINRAPMIHGIRWDKLGLLQRVSHWAGIMHHLEIP